MTCLGGALGGFLILLGTLIPPLGGVIIGTFFGVWKGRDPMTAVDDVPLIRWSGIAAYLIGVVVAVVTNHAGIGIPPLHGILAAGIVAPLAAAVEARLSTRTPQEIR